MCYYISLALAGKLLAMHLGGDDGAPLLLLTA